MNPFELSGFAFLFFYVCLCVGVMLALRLWFKRLEAGAQKPPLKLNDPYLIAYLRGGTEEALKVTTISLADRGLLEVSGDRVRRPQRLAMEHAQRDIEKAVLRFFGTPATGDAVFKDEGARRACAAYQRTLEQHGLLAGPATFVHRLPGALAALAVVVGAASYKVQLALLQGRHNLGFLIALAVIFALLLTGMWRRRRTGAGDEAVADLKQLFKRLRQRGASLQRGGGTNELAMLLGVFGLGAVSAHAFPVIEAIYPKPKVESGSSCGSSPSCGSSCGGGCGGGGCGGE